MIINAKNKIMLYGKYFHFHLNENEMITYKMLMHPITHGRGGVCCVVYPAKVKLNRNTYVRGAEKL